MTRSGRFGVRWARPRAAHLFAGLGFLALVAAVLLHFVYAPRVLWLKAGETEESTLEGTLELSFDPWTARPAIPPRTLEFTDTQRWRIRPGPDGTVVVHVAQDSQAAAALNVDTQVQYVVERATKQNVASDLAWSMQEDNVVDRSPSYSVGLPPGFDPKASYTYHDWVSESAYEIHPLERGRVAGVDFVRFRGDLAGPVAPLFERQLVDFYGLRTSFTAQEFLGLVREQRGVDLTADLTAALAHAGTDAQAAIRQVLEADVPVSHTVSGSQIFDVAVPSGNELRTLRWHTRLVSVPDVSAFEAARAALAASTDPAAATAVAHLDAYLDTDTRMAVYDLAASSSDAAARASAARQRALLSRYGVARGWLPLLLVVAAAGLFGSALSTRHRRAGEAVRAEGDPPPGCRRGGGRHVRGLMPSAPATVPT